MTTIDSGPDIDTANRLLVVSCDAHVGPPYEAYREYCPQKYLDDFDRFNESRRERYAPISPAELRRRLVAAREALLPVARRLDPATIRSDAAWGWVYNIFHGHDLDHLRVLEPWADSLRARQVQNDPFGDPPQPHASNLASAKAAFSADEA